MWYKKLFFDKLTLANMFSLKLVQIDYVIQRAKNEGNAIRKKKANWVYIYHSEDVSKYLQKIKSNVVEDDLKPKFPTSEEIAEQERKKRKYNFIVSSLSLARMVFLLLWLANFWYIYYNWLFWNREVIVLTVLFGLYLGAWNLKTDFVMSNNSKLLLDLKENNVR